MEDYKPPGWSTVVPRIVTIDVELLVHFIKHVFDATGDYLKDRPTVLTIGDSKIMVSAAGIRNSHTSFLYVYVPNLEETYRRAIQAGAQSLEEPANMPYGDRRAMFEDHWGNTWQIATYGTSIE